MKPILELLKMPDRGIRKFRSRRDELINLITDDINLLREGTKYKKTNKRWIAILVNGNPFLKSDDELELLYRECSAKRNYAKLFWVTK